MTRQEILKEVKMPYSVLIQYLIQKYGAAEHDYFATESLKSKNRKASRTSEGLYCHHMDEDKGGNLSTLPQAKMQPFAWQKKERLVYCNAIEHLILHIKILVMRWRVKDIETPADVFRFHSTGGAMRIASDIDDMFMTDGTTLSWKQHCFAAIKDNYIDYVDLIAALMKYIDINYTGIRSATSVLQERIINLDNLTEIPKFIPKEDLYNDKNTTSLPYAEMSYADVYELNIRDLATGYSNFYPSIYFDVKNNSSKFVQDYAEAFSVDFIGYGYPEFSDIKLDTSFHAKNADEYISKALPMYSETNYDFKQKKCVFWQGEILDFVLNDDKMFFIVRLSAMFKIKDGETPFVRYREYGDLRRFPMTIKLSASHNFIHDDYKIIDTSLLYDSKTNSWCSKIKDFSGNIKDIRVILTLGKEDFFLFLKTHTIFSLQTLDGCYFV